MRFRTVTLAVLAAAALLGGCDNVQAPKPDATGDAAFVAQVSALCAKTPVLATINGAAAPAAVASAVAANDATVTNLENAIAALTPSLSDASPLALPVTDLELKLFDAEFSYQRIKDAQKLIAAPTSKARTRRRAQATLIWGPGRSLKRIAEARAELLDIGVKSCFG